MANEFGELIKELKRLQGKEAGGEPLRKALPVGAGVPQKRAPSTSDIKRMSRQLEMMAKSLGPATAVAVPAARKQSKREEVLKSLSTINDRISVGITAGTLTGHQACVLTAKLHHLSDYARERLTAGGR
jgi:hypothetical protein